MNTKKDVDFLVEQFIMDEKSIELNPFLTTRVMASLQNRKEVKVKQLSPVWRTAIVTFGVAMAVLIGFSAGGRYNTGEKKADVVLVRDDTMEHFAFCNEMENE
ncbi:MAG: hypothetical protein IPM85_06225 [Chitinophagaceae bacterium]|nr:hypothetical protein [Chitinophagaceae bacterium]